MQLENLALWIYNRFSIRTVPYYSYRVKNCDTVVWPGKLLTLGHSAYKTQAWVTNTERKTWLCMKPWHFLICFPLQTIQIFGTPPRALQNSIPKQCKQHVIFMPFDHWAILSEPPEVLQLGVQGAEAMLWCNDKLRFVFFYLLSLFHFLGLRFWKGIIKQVSANWQEEHTMVDKKEKEKKNYKVTPRGKSRKLHSKHTHTHTDGF